MVWLRSRLPTTRRDGAAEAKFTGLSKEELLKVAGSPAWVRTRWALLLLFWLGCVRHAGRCRGHHRAGATLPRAARAEMVAKGAPSTALETFGPSWS